MLFLLEAFPLYPSSNLSLDAPSRDALASRIPSPSRLEPRTSLTHFSSPIVRKISSPHPIS
ncbi:hypothetical protein NGA_0082400, partial [Nannochloropsis gaditana CCMP526]|uniref:uncharacterized protein n=1 Tax=Nannochloropsis gaditana (strain CCMP526) TaxID=1093141 RepID=UPI00029F647A